MGKKKKNYTIEAINNIEEDEEEERGVSNNPLLQKQSVCNYIYLVSTLTIINYKPGKTQTEIVEEKQTKMVEKTMSFSLKRKHLLDNILTESRNLGVK